MMNLANLSQMIQVLENNKNDHWIAFDNDKNALYAKKKSSAFSRVWNTIFRKNCYRSIKAEMIAGKVASALEEIFKDARVENLTNQQIDLLKNSKKLIELLSTKIEKKNKDLKDYVKRIDTISTKFFREINTLAINKVKQFEDFFIKIQEVTPGYPEEEKFQKLEESLTRLSRLQKSFVNESIEDQDQEIIKALTARLNDHSKNKALFIKDKYHTKLEELKIQPDRGRLVFFEKQNYKALIDLENSLTNDEWTVLNKIYHNETSQIQKCKILLIENSRKRLDEIKLVAKPSLYSSYLVQIYNQRLTTKIGRFIFEKMLVMADRMAEVDKIKEQMSGHSEILKECLELLEQLESYLAFLTKLSQIPAIIEKSQLKIAVEECLEMEKAIGLTRIDDQLKSSY